jgi:nucleoid DNA-binding protein
MKKKDIVNQVYKEAKAMDYVFTKKEVEDIVNLFIANIREALFDGESVVIQGFGNFFIKQMKEKNCRNPKTGEKIFVPSRKVPKFNFGTSLKKEVIESLN